MRGSRRSVLVCLRCGAVLGGEPTAVSPTGARAGRCLLASGMFVHICLSLRPDVSLCLVPSCPHLSVCVCLFAYPDVCLEDWVAPDEYERCC